MKEVLSEKFSAALERITGDLEQYVVIRAQQKLYEAKSQEKHAALGQMVNFSISGSEMHGDGYPNGEYFARVNQQIADDFGATSMKAEMNGDWAQAVVQRELADRRKAAVVAALKELLEEAVEYGRKTGKQSTKTATPKPSRKK